MTDAPPPVVPDPLARRLLPTGGLRFDRVALAGAGVVAVAVAAYLLGSHDAPPDAARKVADVNAPPPRLPTYGELAPAPTPEPPRPRFEAPAPATAPAPLAAAQAPRPDRLRERAAEAGVGGWSRPRDTGGPMPAGAQAVADAPSVGATAAGCVVPAGTPLPLQSLNAVVSEQGGILVASVTRDVWDASLACLVVPAGSTVTLRVAATSARGQRRVAVSDPTITRPWPLADTLRPDAVGADASGAAGLPGRVDVPWLETGVLVAASTAVDVAVAALTGGGSLVGALLGRNAERPLDRAARDQLQRLPVIELRPGAPFLLLLAAPLQATPFTPPAASGAPG